MYSRPLEIHSNMAKLRAFREVLTTKSCIKLLDKAKHFIHVTVCAVIGKESDGLSSLLELLEPSRASP